MSDYRVLCQTRQEDASRDFYIFSPNEQRVALPGFLFFSLFPVQQTTSEIDHLVK